MNYSTFFSRQARKPSGIFGRFYMSRLFEKGNAELNSFVKETLDIRKADHVLEIGFGTGTLLKGIAETLEGGIIEGVDFSKSMVSIAQKKNKKHIKNGKVKIRMGNFDSLPYEENSFDKIFSVNTIYFWQNPQATISKIFRLLKPGGILFLGFHDKTDMEKMPLNKDVFQYYSTDEAAELLSKDGSLNDVEILSKNGEMKTCYCAVGIK